MTLQDKKTRISEKKELEQNRQIPMVKLWKLLDMKIRNI